MTALTVLYRDEGLIVAVKPAGVLSEDAVGGMPSLIREALGSPGAYVGTVHRLDREVGGVMVYALRHGMAGRLSEALADPAAGKDYLAVLRGRPEGEAGVLRDLLYYDGRTHKSFAVDRKRRGVKEAVLFYRTIRTIRTEGVDLTLVGVRLGTGRTHQIRVQFSSRGLPIVGDGRYGGGRGGLALYACRLTFCHPVTGERLTFSHLPPGAMLGGLALTPEDTVPPDPGCRSAVF